MHAAKAGGSSVNDLRPKEVLFARNGRAAISANRLVSFLGHMRGFLRGFFRVPFRVTYFSGVPSGFPFVLPAAPASMDKRFRGFIHACQS